MICVTGDLHGDLERFKAPELKKLKKSDAFVICGDFGCIWNGGKKEQKILKKLGKKKYNVLFVEGVHENYDILESYPVEEWCGGLTRHISGNLRQLMRGQIFEIAGKRIFTFGGGQREETNSYVECEDVSSIKEIPTDEELETGRISLAENKNEVDYIMTYEPPARLREFIDLGTTDRNHINTYLDSVLENTKFGMWFFGKRHINKLIPPRYYCLFDKVFIADKTRLPKPEKAKRK